MKRCICTLLSAWLLSGCGDTPSDQQPSDAADQPEDTEVEESALIQVPRNRTLIMDCAESGTCAGQIKDYNTFNPYRPESTSRTGYNFVFEPLYFYNAFKGRLIPWIATDHRFNDAYTEVEIIIRPGVQWSDGMPWTAHDLVFTINMLKDNAPLLSYSTDMKNWVQEAVAVDSLTARIALTAPNPRFVFSYFAHNFGNGVPIVPKHVWEGQSPDTFENFDPQKRLARVFRAVQAGALHAATAHLGSAARLVGRGHRLPIPAQSRAHHLPALHGGGQTRPKPDYQPH